MKVTKNFVDMATCLSRYEAPAVEVVEVVIERGFEISSEGVDGPSYGEEDIIW